VVDSDAEQNRPLRRGYMIRNYVCIFVLISIADSALFSVDFRDTLREGDIIFNISQSRQSLAIQKATHSKYSHVGIILNHLERLMVLEAVQPVRYSDIDVWTRSGRDHHFVVKRIKNRDSVLSEGALSTMKRMADSFVGKNYDGVFDWSDERFYCSELVWKLYSRSAGVTIGKPRKIRDFDLSGPEIQYQLRVRYGKSIPYDEPVISPGDMFDSNELITVYRN
jgi:hypothetical protein